MYYHCVEGKVTTINATRIEKSGRTQEKATFGLKIEYQNTPPNVISKNARAFRGKNKTNVSPGQETPKKNGN